MSSETFAEHSENIEVPKDEDDTGPTIRAFIPLQSQDDRERLRGYSGMTGIIDARVACIRPIISDLHFCTTSETDTAIRICGTIKLPRVPRGLMKHHADVQVLEGRFTCAIPESEFLRDPDRVFRIFPGPFEKTWQWCPSEGADLDINYTGELFSQEAPQSLYGYLVWNSGRVSGQFKAVAELYQYLEPSGPFYSDTWLNLNSTGSGPWLDQWYRTPSSALGLDLQLQMPYCYDTFE